MSGNAALKKISPYPHSNTHVSLVNILARLPDKFNRHLPSFFGLDSVIGAAARLKFRITLMEVNYNDGAGDFPAPPFFQVPANTNPYLLTNGRKIACRVVPWAMLLSTDPPVFTACRR